MFDTCPRCGIEFTMRMPDGGPDDTGVSGDGQPYFPFHKAPMNDRADAPVISCGGSLKSQDHLNSNRW